MTCKAEILGKAFKIIITDWFNEIEKVATKERILNANDYFDANVAMLEAMDKCNISYDFSCENCTKLINEAWNIAANMGV